MCKTINACGSHASHQMGLVCNEEGMRKKGRKEKGRERKGEIDFNEFILIFFFFFFFFLLGLKEFSSPVFVQEFYNHNAVIFKV